MTFSKPERTPPTPSHQGPALLGTDPALDIIHHHASVAHISYSPPLKNMWGLVLTENRAGAGRGCSQTLTTPHQKLSKHEVRVPAANYGGTSWHPELSGQPD